MAQSCTITERIVNPQIEPILSQVAPSRHVIALLPSALRSAIYPHLPHQQNELSSTRGEITFQDRKHNRERGIYSKGNKEIYVSLSLIGAPTVNQLQLLSI